MKLRLVEVIRQLPDVRTFVFEPLEPLVWRAGQSIRLEIPRASYGVDERRFTIAAAPAEGLVRITTRLSGSEFKRNLFALALGDLVDAYSVDGSFVWETNAQGLLFLAGGIGITPYYAMLKQQHITSQPLRAALFYASSSGEFVYKAELDAWQQEHPEFLVNYLTGERLTPDFLQRKLGDFADRLVYVSGPATMVSELSSQLAAYGHSESQIRQDQFTGNIN